MNKQTEFRKLNSKKPTVLRTPEHRFKNLKDYPFKPNYTEIDGLRIHYLDEGKKDAEPIVLLHGLPTWSYLYRKMIPILTSSGYRVIAPDLPGYGKSDKLLNKDDYSYAKNVAWIKSLLIEKLELSNINLVVHDWGGLIGLRLVAMEPETFASIVAMNTAFPRFEGVNPSFLFGDK